MSFVGPLLQFKHFWLELGGVQGRILSVINFLVYEKNVTVKPLMHMTQKVSLRTNIYFKTVTSKLSFYINSSINT